MTFTYLTEKLRGTFDSSKLSFSILFFVWFCFCGFCELLDFADYFKNPVIRDSMQYKTLSTMSTIPIYWTFCSRYLWSKSGVKCIIDIIELFCSWIPVIEVIKSKAEDFALLRKTRKTLEDHLFMTCQAEESNFQVAT